MSDGVLGKTSSLLRHVRLPGVADDLVEPAFGGLAGDDGRAARPAAEQSRAVREVQLRLGLLAAVTADALRRQHRANVFAKDRQAPCHLRGVVGFERLAWCGFRFRRRRRQQGASEAA